MKYIIKGFASFFPYGRRDARLQAIIDQTNEEALAQAWEEAFEPFKEVLAPPTLTLDDVKRTQELMDKYKWKARRK